MKVERKAVGRMASGTAGFGTPVSTEVYDSGVNLPLLELVVGPVLSVLDVGCGTGSNARWLRAKNSEGRFDGLTLSAKEAQVAGPSFDRLAVLDLETADLKALGWGAYDLILCSHVLEHLREPAQLVQRLLRLLRPQGVLAIAIPNIAWYGMRLELLRGRFEYKSLGTTDWTHLRFFTFHTAPRYLLPADGEWELAAHRVAASVPLGRLRGWRLLRKPYLQLEKALGRRFPNLFGSQVLLAVRLGSAAGVRGKAASVVDSRLSSLRE